MDKHVAIGKKLIEWGEFFQRTDPNDELMKTWLNEMNDELKNIININPIELVIQKF